MPFTHTPGRARFISFSIHVSPFFPNCFRPFWYVYCWPNCALRFRSSMIQAIAGVMNARGMVEVHPQKGQNNMQEAQKHRNQFNVRHLDQGLPRCWICIQHTGQGGEVLCARNRGRMTHKHELLRGTHRRSGHQEHHDRSGERLSEANEPGR